VPAVELVADCRQEHQQQVLADSVGGVTSLTWLAAQEVPQRLQARQVLQLQTTDFFLPGAAVVAVDLGQLLAEELVVLEGFLPREAVVVEQQRPDLNLELVAPEQMGSQL
jgi:hypothetical protein